MPESQSSAAAPATSAAPITAHSLRPVMNEPGMTPMPWRKKIAPASSATTATTRTARRTISSVPTNISEVHVSRSGTPAPPRRHRRNRDGAWPFEAGSGRQGRLDPRRSRMVQLDGSPAGPVLGVRRRLAEAGGGLLTVLGLGGPIGPGTLAADLVVGTIVV